MQNSFDFTAGEAAKLAGIQQAADHAEAVDPGWNQKAYEMLKEFLDIRLGPFLMEDFRQWAEPSGLNSPPHLRAYGGVALKAAKAGLIRRIGYAKVKNEKAHQANASVWLKNNLHG